jgi:hypothetical protein
MGVSTPVGHNSTVAKPGSRLCDLGLVLPKPAIPFGAHVEASRVGSLLFLNGTLPIANGKSAISNRLRVRRKRKALSECTEIESGRQKYPYRKKLTIKKKGPTMSQINATVTEYLLTPWDVAG